MRFLVVVVVPEEDRISGEGPALFYGPFKSEAEAKDWGIVYFGDTMEYAVFQLLDPEEV